MLRGQLERSAVTRRQQLRLLPGMSSVVWSNCMDDMLGWKISRGSDDRFAGRQPVRILCSTNLTTGFENRRPTRAVDGAVYSASAQQRRVGRVNDRIDVVAGDVADSNRNAIAEKRGQIFCHWISE